MSTFYKMDPAAWDFGTAQLSLEEEAAYLRIVNAIHKHDGPVPNNDRVLAGLFRSSTRKARALLQALIDAGKVHVEGGQIWNERARSDLVHRQFTTISLSVRGSKGGRTRAERAAKSLETSDPPQAVACARIEENRIETDSEANASAASGKIEPSAEDFAKQVFDRAVAFLGRHGTAERQARSLVGKLRQTSNDAAIFEAFAACSKAGAVDPIPWIRQHLASPSMSTKGFRNERRAFDATLRSVAEGLTAGTIRLETESRDPFAKRSGGDPQALQYGSVALLRSGH